MKAAVQQRARELGFEECRVTTADPPASGNHLSSWLAKDRHGEMAWIARNAEKRINPDKVLRGAKSIISLAASYSRNDAEPLSAGQGVVARYAQYKDYHDVLGAKLKALSEFIDRQHGSRSLWYVDTGPLLERDLAQRAGIGFIGKHTNLISRRLGNWIFLAEIITTLELEPDTPEANRCGTCTRCIAACPTAAITAPFQLDARRCISYLTIELKGSIPLEFRRSIGNRIYGCDDCLAACPWNRFAKEGSIMKQHFRSDLATPDLIELLNLDEAAFKQRFAGTPMLRTRRRGILRNVCVALGNVGDQTAFPSLAKASEDAEPLIAEHAQWAIEEIKRRYEQMAKREA